jgi:RHS repeat-associated protein
MLQLTVVKNAEASTIELADNRGFESGDNGIWSANTLLGSQAAGIIAGTYPYHGLWYGYVGNSTNSIGSLFQLLYVPAGAGIATITFYLNVASSETATVTKYDVMDVNFRTYSQDSLIAKLGTFSNLDKAANGVYTQKQFTFNLSAYSSTLILLQFYATNDLSNSTIFRIDDVSVSVAVLDPPGTPSGFSASATSTRITLSWNDVVGATDYEIQWATGQSGPWYGLGLAGQNVTSYPDDRASAGIIYWYQIRARNSTGNSAWSSPVSAALDYTPYVTTRAASGVGSHSATLNSFINPRGVSTSGSFEYGTSTSYGNVTTPTTTGLIGTSDLSYNASVSGLSVNTLYHFRIVSTNVVGQVARGNDLTFTTGTDVAPPVAIIAGNLTPTTGGSTYYGSYSSGSGLSYSWVTSDGQRSYTSTAQFQFNSPGYYSISLTVSDSAQRSSTASISINVRAANSGTTLGVAIGADPVVLATGNYVQNRVDLRMPGKGFPFEFRRFYNSKFSDQTGSPLGFGWTFNYNERLINTGTNVLVVQGDGSTWTFFPTNSAYVGEPGIFDSLGRNPDSTWTLMSKSQTVTLFDSGGRLLSVTDKNTNTLTCSYSAGLLNQIIDTAGRTILFTTNTHSCISSISDPIGRTIQFQYDSRTNLVVVIDANNQTSRYFYDDNHQMTNASDPKGTVYIYNEYDPTSFVVRRQHDAFTNWTCFTYDFTNRITWQTNALGKISTHYFDGRLLETNVVDEMGNQHVFAYDTNHNRTFMQDKNGHQTHFGYDSRGNVTNKIDALNATTTIDYDGLNNPIRRIDALSNITTFGYDARGNLTSTTNALGLTSRVQYESSGLPVILIDARGFSTTNQYDGQGNLTNVINAKGFATGVQYDGVGRKVLQIDPLSRTTSFAYDNNDNLLYTVNALGFTNSFTYDGNNNRTSSCNPRVATTTNVFDLKDRIIAVLAPLNRTNGTIYDALDRRTATFDALGNTTCYAYDDIGNLVAVTNALNQVTRFTYDFQGNQTSIVDPNGHYVTNAFDGLDRMVSMINLSISTNLTAYDSLGHINSKTNAIGQVTLMFYDAIGRLTNVVDAAKKSVFFAYDEAGNRIRTTDPNNHSWTNFFDELNQLIDKDDPQGHKTMFRYDPVGNVTNKLTPNGDSITYSYDALARLTTIVYPKGQPVTFAYDSLGNRTNMTDSLGNTSCQFDLLNRQTSVTDPYAQTIINGFDANGNRLSLVYPGNKIVNYGFDALNRMSALTNWLNGVVTYSYDNLGNWTSVSNANGTLTAFSYDAADRLVALTNAAPDTIVIAAYTLTLDGVGNHTQATLSQPLLPIVLNQTNQYGYDSDNRLVTIDGQSVTHNANGDLTYLGTNGYTYDVEDRLIQLSLTNTSTSFIYDGLGNRLSHTQNGQDQRFVLDRIGLLTQVLVEADSNNSPFAYYVYGLGLAQRISPDGAVATYLFNAQGSTVALTDSGGHVTDSYAYESFGVLVNSNGASPQPFRYLGRYGIVDDSTGLLYARSRYFSPQLGRFLTKDTFGSKDDNGQTLNRYIYAMNNCLRFKDISGLVATEGLFSLTLRSGSSIIIVPEQAEVLRLPRTANSTPTTISGRAGLDFAQVLTFGGIAVQLLVLPETFELVPEEVGLEEASVTALESIEAPSSRILGQNLEDTGFSRPASSAAHHIVAGTDARAAEARALLQDQGIGVNDSENGVFLPRNTSVGNPFGSQIHSVLHTDIYYDAVNAALRNAQPGTFGDVLQDIASQLLTGTFPY